MPNQRLESGFTKKENILTIKIGVTEKPYKTSFSGDCGWGLFSDKYTTNEFILDGAVVGGPGTDGFYEDNRADYTRNEPSLVISRLFLTFFNYFDPSVLIQVNNFY